MGLMSSLETLLDSVNNVMGVIDGKLRNKADKSDVYSKAEIDDPNRTLGANAATAARLKVLRTIALAGHAVGEIGFDGSGNVTMQVSVPGLASKADATDTVTPAQLEARLHEIIGAAPEALNQLEEFARALGEDPDFANTMLTKLADKADKATTYTIVQADGKFLLKTAQAADAAKLGGNAPTYFASAASVSSLDSATADAFVRLAAAFNSGATKINNVGI
ncbi:hypothetical protein OHU52_29835 [Pseudomonas aeruginosa]|uniref:hypothetical protein n=1 Tax=Pseudomonas aeruginosa TaxID=287 RepID=UPI0021E85784|nr:hypothetical protein [Pseudomonas aeruginosa]MCV3804621.1 hypothetical protein [Pseudomonas aeruginosa]MCV3846569.1 hypothetical protein [Pseudomonas aeruginosa]MCV3864678.1 hypothetical protein [Pseudomonas aeruginosa]MCV3984187.1 hypothetical protein [Pseudomonas aeruginosa]MCV3990227.1 hypothetical protein [Pseudomonas aeruginosa]